MAGKKVAALQPQGLRNLRAYNLVQLCRSTFRDIARQGSIDPGLLRPGRGSIAPLGAKNLSTFQDLARQGSIDPGLLRPGRGSIDPLGAKNLEQIYATAKEEPEPYDFHSITEEENSDG